MKQASRRGGTLAPGGVTGPAPVLAIPGTPCVTPGVTLARRLPRSATLMHVLVAASDAPVARDVLREVDSGQPGPPSRSGAPRRSRILAALLIPVALVALVVCLATDVLV